jgi:hypothetical protein
LDPPGYFLAQNIADDYSAWQACDELLRHPDQRETVTEGGSYGQGKASHAVTGYAITGGSAACI